MSVTTTSPEARLLEAEAAEAFAIESRIQDALRRGREAVWDLAHALYDFDEASGWTKLGYERKGDWLAAPCVGMGRETFDRPVRIWRDLVVGMGIDPARLRHLDPSKVDVIRPALKASRVVVSDALDDAEALGWADLRDKYGVKQLKAVECPVQGIEPEPEPEAELEPVVGEVVEAEVVEVVGDLPSWLTPEAARLALADLEEGIESGASLPRISRASAQLARELVQRWTHTSEG
jgi:hypothetical protein